MSRDHFINQFKASLLSPRYNLYSQQKHHGLHNNTLSSMVVWGRIKYQTTVQLLNYTVFVGNFKDLSYNLKNNQVSQLVLGLKLSDQCTPCFKFQKLGKDCEKKTYDREDFWAYDYRYTASDGLDQKQNPLHHYWQKTCGNIKVTS